MSDDTIDRLRELSDFVRRQRVLKIKVAPTLLRDSSGSHMPTMANKLKLGALCRTFELKRSSLDKEKRTVRVQFASEEPVARWFGDEILECTREACDLSRFNAGAAVLIEHDVDQRCGITESGTMTAAHVGEAEIRFSKNERGNAAMAEVEDGTLKWVSVGYRVNKFEVDEDEEEYRAISWEPLEVSFVAIPADPSARVLRSGRNNEEREVLTMMTRSEGGTNQQAAPPASNASAAVITQEDFSRQLDEAREIVALMGHYQKKCPKVVEAGERALKDKTPIAKFQKTVMELIETDSSQDISAPAIGDGQPQRHRGPVSPGERFVTSDAYKRALASGSPAARRAISIFIAEEFQFRSDPALLTRATFSTATEAVSGTAGMNIDARPGMPGILGLQPLLVADLFAQGTTNGDTVRYLREDTFTNAATRVAEGAAKPEASLDISIVNATVEKVAVFLNVTDEMLADFAQMSSFINGRLGYMVEQVTDQQLLSGTGTNQIRGVLNTSGIQTISGATNTIDQFLRAIEYVRGANGVGFGQPDALVINPLNWLSARLTKDANGQYLFGGPGYAPYGVGGYSNMGMAWGVPVLSTTAITAGTALTGAFRTAAQIFRRQGLTIESTNSHASLFVSNIVTIRAEQRLALAVYQPAKFCAITAIP